jgi:WD40-like Beta Propeller Repeat
VLLGMAFAAAWLTTAAAQTPAPRPLAPGVVSTGDIEFAPALTPDGRTLYFAKGSPGMKRAMWIVITRLENGRWTKPEIARPAR